MRADYYLQELIDMVNEVQLKLYVSNLDKYKSKEL